MHPAHAAFELAHDPQPFPVAPICTHAEMNPWICIEVHAFGMLETVTYGGKLVFGRLEGAMHAAASAPGPPLELPLPPPSPGPLLLPIWMPPPELLLDPLEFVPGLLLQPRKPAAVVAATRIDVVKRVFFIMSTGTWFPVGEGQESST